MTKFPVGGPREPVYNFLRQHGFSMARFGDKEWHRHDGAELHIYGSGSKAVIRRNGELIADCALDEAVAKLDAQ